MSFDADMHRGTRDHLAHVVPALAAERVLQAPPAARPLGGVPSHVEKEKWRILPVGDGDNSGGPTLRSGHTSIIAVHTCLDKTSPTGFEPGPSAIPDRATE